MCGVVARRAVLALLARIRSGRLTVCEGYLSFCEAGFAERRIMDVQVVLAKPAYRPALALSATRVAGEHPRAEGVEQEGRAA